jgi:hypothetical protein
MNDVVASSSDGSTRGFLFADLRGYTHLVDTREQSRRATCSDGIGRIVRKVVADHGGAEIKTEGDSFYVVLPSASEALRCGLDILRACGEPEDGGAAIDLGIGIHAGESVAHEGGFVGSAVNIACGSPTRSATQSARLEPMPIPSGKANGPTGFPPVPAEPRMIPERWASVPSGH